LRAAIAACVALALTLAACGSGGGESSAAPASAPTGSAASAAASADYDGLGEYNCAKLGELLEEVVGPGGYEGVPHDERWTVGTRYRGGCAFEGDAEVSIEIHLAEPDEHSILWVTVPDREAEQAELATDVGDEAYLESTDDGLDLTARKGLVEVSLKHPAFGANTLNADQMSSLAAAILEPWPSGPGADESLGQPSPPDLPLPVGVASADLTYFDIDEFVRKMEEISADEGEPILDPEVSASYFHVQFPASRTAAEAYCEELRDAGLDEAPEEALGGASAQGDSSEGEVCSLADGEEWMASVSAISDEYLLTFTPWEDVVRVVSVCEEDPSRCQGNRE
jgi:hypothetical protein